MGNGTKSGSISDLFTGFAPYNFQIQMLGSTGCAFPKFSSFLIDVSGALLRTASFNSTTESNKTCNLVFDVEIDSSDLSKGMFWSGRTNIGNMNALPTF